MIDERRMRVMIVDDEPSVNESLAGFLEDHEFEVVSAASGEEAMELWRQQPGDVAVVDMRLPGVDGDTLIRQLHRIVPQADYLIYTGSVNYGLSSYLEKIGVHQHHVLHKPLPDLSLLVDRIREIRKEVRP